MPLFDYRCPACDRVFELLVRADTVPACPTCGGTALEKQLSRPAAPGKSAGRNSRGSGTSWWPASRWAMRCCAAPVPKPPAKATSAITPPTRSPRPDPPAHAWCIMAQRNAMTAHTLEILVLTLATATQLAAALVAFYLMRFSGAYRYAWLCISVALFLMPDRRAEPLYAALTRGSTDNLNAWVGLAISIFMLVGVLGVKNLFLQLKAQERSLRRQASTDSLTGVPNRRATLASARHEVERHLRLGHPLAALMLDIDHFKRVNDTHGHATGDDVLKAVAATCRSSLRNIDVFGRIGGEEFLVILPEAGRDEALEIGERLRTAVATQAGAGGLPAVTVSVGIALLDSEKQHSDAALDRLMARADAALYAAKSGGRDRVELA